MAIQIASLNSGSNGNCYYVGNETDAVLIDAGISCRETERRMQSLDLDMSRIRAIFITHEHSDHISGLPVLSRRYKIPVYITEKTQKAGLLKLESELVHRFEAEVPISVAGISVFPFRKFHDAADPHSFVVSSGETHIGVMTDIGRNCDQVVHYFKQCQAVFLESNYDTDMLMNGSYPIYLKKRISGGEGHLSNDEALDLLTRYRNAELQHLILSHLSKNNNSPERVEAAFKPHARHTALHIASRYGTSPVFHVEAQSGKPVQLKKAFVEPEQLSLFGSES